MTKTATFPREYKHLFFRDVDKDFFLITILTFLTLISFTFYMSGKGLTNLSVKDARQHIKDLYVHYRVKAAPSPRKAVVSNQDTDALNTIVKTLAAKEKQKIDTVEKKHISVVSKKELRAEKRADRLDRQELKRQKAKAAATKTGIIGGPTSKGINRHAGSGSKTFESLGLSVSEVKATDIKNMTGVTDNAVKAERVKKHRNNTVVSEDVSEFSLEELKEIEFDNDMMFEETTVDLPRNAITAKGRAAKTVQRNRQAITEVVLLNKNQVQYCYWNYKRRDSSLKGRVTVKFTIDPAGKVIKVHFHRSNWYGNRLGRDVERCIKDVINRWRFEPINEKAGNVTANVVYVFQ